ncbi:cell division cycle 7-related kinase isoform X2 [Brachionus plicatilis]|uniref:non-specific serine/threonine protein kinase n=1 Tax=Brachionus plicatilis TaxID=10195 RepID=A0A3M7TBC8_BRAPC|nr:cell division cycle 7-related kinase isoform X2 [Brachionus plicatilis]
MDDIEDLYNLFPEIKDHICVSKKIGQGTFSYVYLGQVLSKPDKKVALKYVIPSSSPSRTKQEIDCLLNIGGTENVIGVNAVLRNKSHILIIMPFIEHESFNDTFISWNLEEVRDYMKALLIALNRVHQCGIIHRDVKPSNFLYDRNKKMYALVDFGLAQNYDKSSENIFNYEKLNKNRSINENIPARKNMIAINSKKTAGHLILTAPKTQNKSEVNSLPHGPSSEKSQISNSQSFDRNLNEQTKKATSPNLNSHSKKFDSPKTNANTLQKYYSFQKSAFSDKCNCYNMPIVCEICTARSNKWAPRAGTAGFRAPEVLFRSNYQTPAVDIWSAGIVFLSILSGRYPFFKAVDDNMAIMQLVSLFGAESVRKSSIKYGESFVCSHDKKPEELKDICTKLRRKTASSLGSKKNSNSEILEEFPDCAYDLLKKLLDLDYEKRLSAECALKHQFFQN